MTVRITETRVPEDPNPTRVDLVSISGQVRALQAENDDLRRQLDQALDAAAEQAEAGMDDFEDRVEAEMLRTLAEHLNAHTELEMGSVVNGGDMVVPGVEGIRAWHDSLRSPRMEAAAIESHGTTLLTLTGYLAPGKAITCRTVLHEHAPELLGDVYRPHQRVIVPRAALDQYMAEVERLGGTE